MDFPKTDGSGKNTFFSVPRTYDDVGMNIKIYSFIDVIYSESEPNVGIEPETSVFELLFKRTGNREFVWRNLK